MSALNRVRGDEGVTLVLASLAMLSILIVTAIVIDLGFARAERREAQTVVDLAALAGGEHLASATEPANPLLACEDAVEYLQLNLSAYPSGNTMPCGDLPDPCDDTTPPVTITDGGVADPFTLSITFPVPDSDITDDRVAGGLRNLDGRQCERMRVELAWTHPGFFSRAISEDGLRVRASAVVRRIPVDATRVPSLWLLEPHECNVLIAQGGGTVTVGLPDRSGLITADSSGTGGGCNASNNTVISAQGSSVPAIWSMPDDVDPPGQISLVAMDNGQTNCDTGNTFACNQAHIDSGHIDPMPIPRNAPATRALVDHVYNCKASYPDYDSLTDAKNTRTLGNQPAIPIFGCPDADARYATIDEVTDYVGAAGLPDGTWNRWTDHHSCTVGSSLPEVFGNWVVDCNTLRIQNNGIVRFSGGNLIFDGDINLQGGGILLVNGTYFGGFVQTNPVDDLMTIPECANWTPACLPFSANNAAWMYMRDGTFTQAGGSGLLMNSTTLIQAPIDGNNVDIGGGQAIWSAPEVGPMTGLALWSEGFSGSFRLRGAGGVELQGVFFTPEANPFTLRGSGDMNPQEAQFISRRVDVAGGGAIRLYPMGTQMIVIPPPAAFLIR
jgi:hypothetical protein